MTNLSAKITENKRRARAWINEARESLAIGDRFNAAFCLNGAARARANVRDLLARMTPLQALYDAWNEAETAWMSEIVKAIPRGQACDLRYTDQGKGAPETALRAAYDAFTRAAAAFHDAVADQRKPFSFL